MLGKKIPRSPSVRGTLNLSTKSKIRVGIVTEMVNGLMDAHAVSEQFYESMCCDVWLVLRLEWRQDAWLVYYQLRPQRGRVECFVLPVSFSQPGEVMGEKGQILALGDQGQPTHYPPVQVLREGAWNMVKIQGSLFSHEWSDRLFSLSVAAKSNKRFERKGGCVLDSDWHHR